MIVFKGQKITNCCNPEYIAKLAPHKLQGFLTVDIEKKYMDRPEVKILSVWQNFFKTKGVPFITVAGDNGTGRTLWKEMYVKCASTYINKKG